MRPSILFFTFIAVGAEKSRNPDHYIRRRREKFFVFYAVQNLHLSLRGTKQPRTVQVRPVQFAVAALVPRSQ